MPTPTILDYYKYAALATAAYVRMGTEPLTGARFAAVAEDQLRLPLVLGQFLFSPTETFPNPNPWEIKHYYGGDVPGVRDNTGFAATLFERNGERVLAIRGTEPTADFAVDLLGADLGGIGLLGSAITQVVSMTNLIMRLTAPQGSPVRQVAVTATLIPPARDFVMLRGSQVLEGISVPAPVFLAFSAFEGRGEAPASGNVRLTVTGHSLSGHLAVLAARLFPQRINPEVFVYNSPGFDPVAANFAAALRGTPGLLASVVTGLAKASLATSLGPGALFLSGSAQRATERFVAVLANLTGANPLGSFGALTVRNVEGEDSAPGNDLSVVASVFTAAQGLGPETFVPVEVNSHSIEQLTDALALHALLGKLDGNLRFADIARLVAATTHEPARSEERLVEALQNLLLPPEERVRLDTSDASSGFDVWAGAGDVNARDQYHTALLKLDKAIEGKDYRLDLLLDLSPTDLANLAQGSEAIAYRYALKELNPFAVIDVSGALYVRFLPNGDNAGELDLYDAGNRTGTLTEDWIKNRAGLLYADAIRNTQDNPDFASIAIAGGSSTEYRYYAEGKERVLFEDPAAGARPRSERLVAFADDAGRLLVGSDNLRGDHLFGGAGNDTLQGNRGNDFLEGGHGNDAYVWNTGDGFDTILDTDGVGRLLVNGKFVSGGIRVAQNDYIDADKQSLHFVGDLLSDGVLIVNGDLRIGNFRNGDLGIVLSDQGSLAEIQPTVLTYRGATDTPVDEINVFGSDGNDHFIAGPGFSYFLGKSGDDLLEGNHWDSLHGGPGNDIVSAGIFFGLPPNPGDRVLTGGAGSDVILGGVNGELIAGDMSDAVFSFTSESFTLDLFSYDAESQSGQYRNSLGGFGIPSTDEPIFFAGGAAEALHYVLGVSASTDLSTHYDDFVDAGDGPDRILGGHGSDLLIGGAGDDVMDGDGSESVFNVSRIQDDAWRDMVTRLLGQPGDDYLDGGPGNDRLTDHSGGNDVLIGGPGNDVIISDSPGNSELSYSDHLEGGEGNDRLFSLNRSFDGRHTLVGGPGDDRLTVQLGSAFLEGGPGSDNYIYSPSKISKLVIDDHDDGGGLDRLYLISTSEAPVSSADLVPTRDESNLHLSFSGMLERVTVLNWFAGSEYKIEQLVIGGFTGSEGSDVITPRPNAQIYDVAAIEALFTTPSSGADFLWGSRADDQFAGGLGDDTLFGSDGRDTLAGNEGQDALDGGEDGDTYVFNLGDGIDRLLDTGDFGGDVIAFGPGITPDMLTLALGSLLIKVGDGGDAIHLDGFEPDNALGSGTIEHFNFAEGATLAYWQLLDRGFDHAGTDGGDMMAGTSVNDRFAGGRGNDTYIFGRGSGQDLIEDVDLTGLDSDAVRLRADVLPADIIVARAGDFIALSIDDTGDQLSIRWQPEAGYQVEHIAFVDGTVWDAATLENMAVAGGGNTAPTLANAIVDQAAREDSLFNFAVPAGTFVDGDAGDALTLSAALADGSPVLGWLSFDAAAQSFSGTPANGDVGAFEVTVTATDTGGLAASDTFQLTVANTNDAPVLVQPLPDQFANQNAPVSFPLPPRTFADVDVGDRHDLSATLAEGSALPAWLAFDSAAGSFSGTPSEFDVGGIDIRVTATDRAGAATSDTFTLSVSDASVVNETHVGTRRDDVIVTGFANDWIDAGGGNDRVRAGAGRDVILGGRGNDRLVGGAGNDLYIHDRHDGHDVIEETGGLDTLFLGEGISPVGVRLERRRDDLVVDLKGADGSVTVKDWFASDAAKVETIQFADGTAWGVDEISARAQRKRSERRRDDDHEHAHQDGGRDDDHHGKSDGRKHDDGDGSRPEHKPDRIADLLEAVLARKPRYDFEALELEFGRPQRRGEDLDAREIARRWEVIRRYANGTASEREEDARGGAVHHGDWGALVAGIDFGRGGFDTGWSELARGAANPRTLQGLEEGLQRLRG